MHRMTGTDAGFLSIETDRWPMHTLKISIIDPGPDYSFERAKEYFARNIHRLPPLRWRMLPTPLRINHPLLLPDPEFDIDFHVHRMYCPPPGGPKEFGALVSDLVRRPLERTRPLWEMYLVEGLEEGKVASVVKLHHALADGAASAVLLNEFFVKMPGAEHPPEAEPWNPEPLPGKAKLIALGVRDAARLVRHDGPVFLKRAKEVKIWRKSQPDDPALKAPAPFSAPELPINHDVSQHRNFAFTTLSLQDAKDVRTKFGTTINDVALAVTAGALRRYLLAHDMLPEQPLVALMPFSTREPGDNPMWGNHVYMMWVRLRTDVADPVERLRAARGEAALTKEEMMGTKGARIDDMTELGPPVFSTVLTKFVQFLARTTKKPLYNVVMSNVAGPSEPLFAGTHPVSAFYSVANISEDMPLNMTMWSYVDQLNFSLLSCAKQIPDLWTITDGIREELALLVKAASSDE